MTDTRENSPSGVLYVVATPIGNLGDMVPRGVEILQQADLIAAEDTRHSKRLLEHFHISTPAIAYHDHNESRSAGQLLEKLRAGQTLALISDAGTPLISDPGYRLVRAARRDGIPVVPVPGACALVAALSASGLPSDRFAFEGFAPAKQTQRRQYFQSLSRETRTLIFYESPHRLPACLTDMAAVFGAEREGVLARELTKTFETILAGSLDSLLMQVTADANQQKGEMVLLVRGARPEASTTVDAEAQRVMTLLQAELPPRRAAALTAEITGVDKKVLYEWAAKGD